LSPGRRVLLRHPRPGDLTAPDGSAQTFVQVDSFTMEAGWAGEGRVDQPFMKYFALSVPRT
jgi:uncharacterized cupin superfamily protein